MDKVRKSCVKNFVQYNICYDKKMSLYYQRYIGAILCLFTTLVLLFKDLDWMRKESGSYTAKLVMILFTIAYCMTVIVVPIWYRHCKKYNEKEALVLMNIFTDIIGCIAFTYMGITAFIFPIRGYKETLILLLLLCVTYVANFVNRKSRIIKIMKEDGFNLRKNNDAFKRFDSFNRYIRTTPTLIAVVFVSGLFLKRSISGLAILGYIIAILPLSLTDVPICGLLQIKYAREYDMQEYLPTKSRKELEKEEES